MAIYDIIVTTGQSQNQGVGYGQDAPAVDPALHKEWLTLSGDSGAGTISTIVEPYPSGTNSFKPLTGSCIPGMARAFTHYSERPVLVIRCAYGGSSLMAVNQGTKGHWGTEGGQAWFPVAVTRFNNAKTALLAAGHTIGKVLITWSGGYADNKTGQNLDLPPEDPDGFTYQQAHLLTRFRAAFNPVGLPPLEEIHMYLDENYSPKVDDNDAAMQAKMEIIKAAQHTAMTMVGGIYIGFNEGEWISNHASTFGAQGWVKAIDNLHFGQKGLNYMGSGSEFGTGLAGFGGNMGANEFDGEVEPEPEVPDDPKTAVSKVGHRLILIDPYIAPVIPPDPVAWVHNHPGGAESVASATLTTSLDAIVEAGNTLLMDFGVDNLASSTGPKISTISKPLGEINNWYQVDFYDPATGTGGTSVGGELWRIDTTMDWPADFQPIVNYVSSRSARAAVITEFQGVGVLRGKAVPGTSLTGTPVATYGGAEIGDLLVGYCGFEQGTAAISGDADSAGGASWSAAHSIGVTGGLNELARIRVSMQWKIVLATGTQTYNPTGSSTDSGAGLVAFAPAV